MIANDADHSSNERTFLAWVRTAIAVVEFGIGATRIGSYAGIGLVRSGAFAQRWDRDHHYLHSFEQGAGLDQGARGIWRRSDGC
ncbi:DUF202 domain-containing protein [Yoonia sp. MH D7]